MLSHVSHVLSTESHHVGFAVAPATDDQRLRKIEFVSLEGARVLVVTLADGGQVTQKVVDAGEPLSPEELRRAAEYVNSQFAGLPIDQVQAEILARLHEARGLYDRLMTRAFDLARRALEHRARRNSIYVEGTASLLGDAQQSSEMSLQTLRTLVEMIEEKQRLVRLLEEYLHAPGPGRRHRRRALAARSETVQPGRGLVSRRPRRRQPRRHRADPHALLARHQPGGKRRQGRDRRARPQLTDVKCPRRAVRPEPQARCDVLLNPT